MQLPLSLVALGGCALLLAVAAGYGPLDWSHLRREISWSPFVFISGMFVVVRAREQLGLVLVTTVGTALGANLINNVPMALVMIIALRSVHVAAGTHQALVYGTLLGADLRPLYRSSVQPHERMPWLLPTLLVWVQVGAPGPKRSAPCCRAVAVVTQTHQGSRILQRPRRHAKRVGRPPPDVLWERLVQERLSFLGSPQQWHRRKFEDVVANEPLLLKRIISY